MSNYVTTKIVCQHLNVLYVRSTVNVPQVVNVLKCNFDISKLKGIKNKFGVI